MTEEVTQVVPTADDQVQNGAVTPATEIADQGDQQAQQATDQQPTETQDPQQPKRQPWYERRIDEVTRARREAERERDALRAMIERQASQPDQAAQAQPQAADPYELAKQIAHQQTLNEAANRTYEAGKAEFGADFDAAVSTLQQVTDLSKRTDFLEAVTALPNAHAVYHHLGKNPDEAAHVLALPPVKMAIELANMSAKVGRPKAQSKAPAPITPLGRSATPSADLSDDLSTAEWIARREAQLEKRRQR